MRLPLLTLLVAVPLSGRPTTPDAYRNGWDLIAKGEYAAAVQEFLTALKTDNDQPRLYYGLGVAYRNLNQFDNALMTFTRALESRNTDTALRIDVHREMMRTFLQSGRPRRAVQTGLAAVKSLPADAAILKELARAYLRLNDHAKALRSAELAVSLDPADAEAYHLLGQAHMALGRLDAAQTAFETAAAFQPESHLFFAAAAKVAERRGDLKAALGHYRTALRLNPDPEYRTALQRLQQSTNRGLRP